MDQIDKDVIEADKMKLSYGYYKARSYVPGQGTPTIKKKKGIARPRKFTDREAFTLWQSRMTDAEIGRALGVSRAYIQRWRDQLELPSTAKIRIDTKKYRLAQMQDGTSVVLKNDEF